MNIHITPNDILLVKGFAKVECHNNAHILGFNIRDSIIKIDENRMLPIEAYEECDILIELGNNGKYEIKERVGLGTQIWDDIKDAVLFKQVNTIMIVGANDSGKSTLTVYLTNLLVRKRKIFIIDGDVGQGDLVPPACIGASKINEHTLFLNRKADIYSFIGSTTPSDASYLIINSIKRLYDKRDDSFVIINTDGYMDKYGLLYKFKLIDIIKPDIITCLGNDYSQILLKRYPGKIYFANKPRGVEKDPKTRSFNRLRRYKQFIGIGKRTFNIKSKKIWLFGNTYDCTIKDQYLILEPLGPVLHTLLLKDMYVALAIDDYVVGFGVIRRVNHEFLLQTAYEGEFNTIMLSKIKLDNDLSNEHKIRYIP